MFYKFEMTKRKRILVVARWPLGGIRTYMKYVYKFLPSDFCMTVLAASTHEDKALRKDVTTIGAQLVLCYHKKIFASLMVGVFREFLKGRFDVVQSQGFISAIASFPAAFIFRVPHVVTVHGIIEAKYISGRFAILKKWLLGIILNNCTVIYAVSNDILEHLYDVFPQLRHSKVRKVVIHNGIDVEQFDPYKIVPKVLRVDLHLRDNIFLFGFLGRFMQQKGFIFLIDAVEVLKSAGTRDFSVIAVGSEDYLPYYQKIIRERGLESFFHFMPFSSEIAGIYAGIDAVVMPSIWEASGLLAMEALCMGVPLISSDCIGLRETVTGTPAITFPSKDFSALAAAMLDLMKHPQRDIFSAFVPEARRRYDVANTAQVFNKLIEEVVLD